MALKSLLGFGLLLTCCLLEVQSRTTNESTKIELPIDEQQEDGIDKFEKSFTIEVDTQTPPYSESMREIIDKIQAVNNGLKKPQKLQIKHNKAPQLPAGYVIDQDLLEKIQQAIMSSKIRPNYETPEQLESNLVNEDSINYRQEHARAFQTFPNAFNQQSLSPMPVPYIMNVPVVVMPSSNAVRYANNDPNSLHSSNNFQTRQEQPSPFPFLPSFPSNFQWPFQFPSPFASFFPLIIKDPLIALQQGGGWNNFFENGQAADVCSRKQKAIKETSKNDDEIEELLKAIKNLKDKTSYLQDTELIEESDQTMDPVLDENTRQARAMKKRTIANTAPEQEVETSKKTQKIYVAKPVVTRKPPSKIYIEEEESQDTKNVPDGDLRFPFGGFDWFGNKKPVAPSPGFFINRLRVRKGGVAIAGPGGVATAGRGGTAIVGPGGLAYTQPGGLAVAGPAARVVALSSETDLNSVVTRLREFNDTSLPLKQPIREGKVVATGPVIYYHPNEQT